MRLNKTALLGSAAALALSVGTAGFGVEAEAFDEVHWHWDKHITEIVTKNVNIDVNINPIGDITDQVLQMQIGNIRARSSTHDIKNANPLEQVEWKKGWKNEAGLTVDGSLNYSLFGGGETTSTKTEKFDSSNLVSIDNATLNTYATEDKWGGAVDGGVTTTSVDGPAGFIGGAGYVTGGLTVTDGEFDLNPLSGDLEGDVIGGGGPFAVGAIGGAATNGDASFTGALNTTGTTSGFNDATTVTNNLTIVDNDSTAFRSNAYTYDFNGEGAAGFELRSTSWDITTYYGLAPKVVDALEELPYVVDQATAIGNMVSITSDVMVEEHSAQILFDTVGDRRTCKTELCEPGPIAKVNFEEADFDLDADLSVNDREKDLHTQNYFHDLALLFGLAAGAGLIDQAEISSKSEVYNIYQATGSASASSFGNLKSITVDTNNPDNGVVLADVTQLSVANVSADAEARDIYLENFTNLGKLDRAIASSTATAIGNTLAITVNSGQNFGGGAP